jgi:hypothetical protein
MVQRPLFQFAVDPLAFRLGEDGVDGRFALG